MCIVLLIAVIITACVFAAEIGIPLAIFSQVEWECSADFDEYSNDFMAVKDFILSKYSGQDDKWLFVSENGEKGITFCDPNNGEYIEIPDDVKTALGRINDNAFPCKDSDLYTVSVYEGSVYFDISNGRYALAYSPDTKQKWISPSYPDIKVKLKTLGGGWYHVLVD